MSAVQKAQTARLLDVIDKYQHAHYGVSPSVRDVADGMGRAGFGTVNQLIHEAVEEGYLIVAVPNASRGIVLSAAGHSALLGARQQWALARESA